MTLIFTDGSSRGNPGPGGWGAIVVTEDRVMELGGREDQTTNNRMELTAVIKALEKFPNEREITIYTDSAYVLNGATRWVFAWNKNNWKTSTKEDVLNKDLWEKILSLISHKIIDWQLVKGHSGTPGNERCDVIATSFADLSSESEENSIILYSGSRDRYGVSIKVPEQKPKTKSKSKAYSYVSMVDGQIKVHKTWDECKERVSGSSGAKYKKTTSPENEQEIIKEFLG